MNRTLKLIVSMQATISINVVIYYLKKIPVLGSLFPETLYRNEKLKMVIAIISSIVVALFRLFILCIYFGIAVYIPMEFFVLHNVNKSISSLSMGIQIIFFIFCIMGGLQDSIIFKVTKSKFVCLKYMRMSPREYIVNVMVIEYILKFFYMFCIVTVFIMKIGGEFCQALLLWIIYVCFRVSGEAIQLWAFDKWGKVLCRKSSYLVILVITAAVLAYYPMVIKGPIFLVGDIVLKAPSIILFVIFGFLGASYIWNYQGYTNKIICVIEAKELLSEVVLSSWNEINNKEPNDISNECVEDFIDLEKSKGYQYLNHIFNTRYYKYINKMMRWRIVLLICMFLLLIVLSFYDADLVAAIIGRKTMLISILVLSVSLLCVGESYCKFLFDNCDSSLLKYSFYRTKRSIHQHFFIRFKKMLYCNLLIASGLSLMLVCAIGMVDTINFLDILLMVATVYSLCVFYSIFHISFYYLFQPYVLGLGLNGNMLLYQSGYSFIVCIVVTKIRIPPNIFMMGLIFFSYAFLGIAIYRIEKKAYKTFRIK